MWSSSTVQKIVLQCVPRVLKPKLGPSHRASVGRNMPSVAFSAAFLTKQRPSTCLSGVLTITEEHFVARKHWSRFILFFVPRYRLIHNFSFSSWIELSEHGGRRDGERQQHTRSFMSYRSSSRPLMSGWWLNILNFEFSSVVSVLCFRCIHRVRMMAHLRTTEL